MKSPLPKQAMPVLLAVCCLFAGSSFAQTHDHMAMASSSPGSAAFLFGIMELPFLIIATVFAFMTAASLKGGKFGRGMNLIAWGFIVMAVGHLHMQIEHFYGVHIFKSLMGDLLGQIAWYIALVTTWGLSGMGFYSIYKATKGA